MEKPTPLLRPLFPLFDLPFLLLVVLPSFVFPFLFLLLLALVVSALFVEGN